MFLRKGSGRFIDCPNQVFHRLCAGLQDRQLTMSQLHRVVNKSDLAHELGLCGKSLDEYPANFLAKWEQENKAKYEGMLRNQSLERQAYCLNQNPDRVGKSTCNGILPLFTKTDKMTWLPSQGRHLLAKEKYAGHGFAVTPELASLLKVPVT